MSDSKSLSNWRERIGRREFLGAGAATLAAAASQASVPHAASGPAGMRFDETIDVAVVGSGAAGATAALFARREGATVVILEKAGHLGGTTAKSGGNIWVPNNKSMRERGIADSKPDFIRFAARSGFPSQYAPEAENLGIGARSYDLLSTFYDQAAPTIETLAKWGAARIQRFHFGPDSIPDAPDYNENLAEDTVKRGRVMAPFADDGSMGVGSELMVQLQAALEREQIGTRLRTAAVALIRGDDDTVIGLELTDAFGARKLLRTRRGVVFASGGFTHNKDLLQRYHAHPISGGCSLPTCTGDFVSIAARMGAQLGNMSSAWRAQVVLEDAIQYGSTPNNVWTIPGDSVILVNHAGQRVVNEKRSYHERTKAMYAWDANTTNYPSRLLLQVYDERVARMCAGLYPLPDVPDGLRFVLVGRDLADLARAVRRRLEELSPHIAQFQLDDAFDANLAATVRRFNEFARASVDRDFSRGSFEYDTHYHMLLSGRPSDRYPANPLANPTMFPFADKGPYYAIILAPGTLDTNGGPTIDSRARVLDVNERPIARLYGAGNCIASAAGESYWGAGATISNAMTFGAIAGRNVARESPLGA